MKSVRSAENEVYKHDPLEFKATSNPISETTKSVRGAEWLSPWVSAETNQPRHVIIHQKY